MFHLFKKTVKLPTTPEAFDSLVELIVKKYGLVDKNHAAACVSVAIRHLPVEQAYTTYDYLGHYVIKNIANYVAHHKAELMKHNSQVDQLEQIIKLDPGNQQARDELTKAAKDGSEYAKEAAARVLITIDPPPAEIN